jgi:hypothetical protein
MNAGMAGRQSQPAGKHSVDICRSTPRALDELEQQIRDAFAAVFLNFFRKSVECVTYRLQKCVLNSGACVEDGTKWQRIGSTMVREL